MSSMTKDTCYFYITDYPKGVFVVVGSNSAFLQCHADGETFRHVFMLDIEICFQCLIMGLWTTCEISLAGMTVFKLAR